MPDNPISQTEWTLVQRYLIGPVTPAETDAAQAVVQREPRLQALVDVLQTTALVTDSPTIDLGSLKRRIDATRIAAPSSAAWPGGSKKQPLRWGVWYTVVGAVAGVLAIVAVWRVGAPHLMGHRSVAMSTYVTGRGERANVTLPDGSTVALDVASRLEVPADYLTGDHTVRLTGEAMFSVQHHDGVPFIVVAGPAAAQVLGTTFLVRHFATDTSTRVAVRDGKVAVRSALFQPVVLTAGRQMVVGRRGSAVVQMADPSQFGFATGTLTLKDVPISEAIAELDRWYDADIRLGDPALQDKDFDGECAAGSLADLTSFLGYVLDVRVVRHGREITLWPR